MPLTGQDYATEALRELAVIGAVDPASPEDSAVMLGLMNRIFDDWNAEKKAIYAWQFLPFTLTPNLQPHTIGLAANLPTWSVTGVRPQKITGANLILNNVTPNLNTPIRIASAQWWLGQPVPALATSIPTDLFYSPDWPNGSCYFWPVPTVAYGVELQVPIALADVTLISTISMPPGYHSALVLTMAEQGAGVMKVELPPMLPTLARHARARIFNANGESFPLATRDSGMPGGGESAQTTSFNYRSRTW